MGPRRSWGWLFSSRLRDLRPGQASVGQALADDASEGQREPRRIGHRPVVETERLLVQISEQMERLDTHVGPLNGSLEERPEVLAAIGVDLAINVALGVVDDLVRVVSVESFVGQQEIGVDCGPGSDMLPDVSLEGLLSDVRNHVGPNLGDAVLAVAVEQSHDRDLSGDAAATLDVQALPLARVHVPGLAPDVGLVGLDGAAELAAGFVLQRETETREHEPGGLLGYAQVPSQFVAADPVLAVGEQPEGGQPLVEAKRGVLEDGPDLERELRARMLLVALPALLIRKVSDTVRAAARAAHDAVRPADRLYSLAAVLVVGEEDDGFPEGLGGVVLSCHIPSVGTI